MNGISVDWHWWGPRLCPLRHWLYSMEFLGISWSDRITNATIMEKVGHEEILLRNEKILLRLRDIQRAQLRYFGHIARRDATLLEKIAMLGFVEGTRSRGRPLQRWTDNFGIPNLVKSKLLFLCCNVLSPSPPYAAPKGS